MLLKVTKIKSGYGKVSILHGVDFNVLPGQIITVLGPNGAGKSTLMKAIAGQLPVSSGTIEFSGTLTNGLSAQEVNKLGIGYVPQEQNVFAELTVMENMKVAAMPFKDAGSRVDRVMDHFPILKERAAQMASTLSGGERQTLAISAALVAEPKVLLLDEPTAGLAPIFVDRIIEWITELASEGMAVVWVVEQDPEKILTVSQMTCFIEGGRSTAWLESEILLEPGRLQQMLLEDKKCSK
ncbi:ABC transporter ATP-binding protein [Desulforhopalus singaporensis]|uniref:Amino acid/amide ABC transporter ATP-binding protein 2, HAAT family n=1 Tax=Desulforhopalus singaporensis TaxID=91360 RepID=A0A1H0VBM1_9BACT|nr:ABC transporter ATP-binding protein [Desulforhopalus singaporensis]SDP75820.1 amino acid/amide ABC transporter ATP-binding protein 2, HAAT family [Desulforhopalus singaporensis]